MTAPPGEHEPAAVRPCRFCLGFVIQRAVARREGLWTKAAALEKELHQHELEHQRKEARS
ncbi:hypothetical protein ACFP1Z_02910 [Streptomyces gamaensis]|uniref:Uncharacterized protein n=1 Tax=Streptomyces gamaensis TaxID=1763542 RepID=A0ABW0YV75_9ACTN